MPRDLSVIRSALTAYLPQGREITGVCVLTAGNSNETYLVEGLDLVLRLPPSEAPLLEHNRVHGVVGQYRILQELGLRGHGLPVPAVVQFEQDPTVLLSTWSALSFGWRSSCCWRPRLPMRSPLRATATPSSPIPSGMRAG